MLCVVEETKDVWAIERTGEYRGKYHVLGGSLSPIDGLGPDQLRIRELVTRLSDGSVTEVILATDPNLEGEATASYLSRLLDQPGLRVTRLASGLPVGGDFGIRGRSHSRPGLFWSPSGLMTDCDQGESVSCVIEWRLFFRWIQRF